MLTPHSTATKPGDFRRIAIQPSQAVDLDYILANLGRVSANLHHNKALSRTYWHEGKIACIAGVTPHGNRGWALFSRHAGRMVRGRIAVDIRNRLRSQGVTLCATIDTRFSERETFARGLGLAPKEDGLWHTD